jgi:ATP-dependent RNA helicase DDX21
MQVRDEIATLRLHDKDDFAVLAVYGGTGMHEQSESLERGVDVVVGTPGRLVDFMDRGHLKFKDLEMVCLDEADEMLKIGFKEEIEKIFGCIKKSTTTQIQCLLFSATLPDWIWEISRHYQSKDKKVIDMIKDSHVKTSKTVEHFSLKTSSMEK